MESCPSMDGLNSTPSDRWAHFPPSQLVKLSILVLLLLLVFCFNLFLLLKPSPQGRRKTACDLLVTTLATVGLVNGLLNLLPYLVSTVTGDRILGDTFCQFQGLFGEVTIGVWRWGLVIASCERYLRLLDPYEHQSYFSLLNTKLIIGGMVLLLFVIHMGPVYGWGEYSTFRGKLDLTLTIKENTSTLGPEGLQLATAYLNTLPHTPDSPISNLSTYLQEVRKVILHRPHPGPRGLVLPLRASSGDALTCLWAQYLNGSLVESVQDLLLSNLSSAIPGVPEFELAASIEREDFLVYRDIYIPYQECAMCSFDYSTVNNHVYVFIGFTWLTCLLLPLLITAGCYTRLFWAGIHRTCIVTQEGKTQEDILWMWVFACTSFMSIACAVALAVISFLGGHGVYIPAQVHFALMSLVYSNPCLLGIFYIITVRMLNTQLNGGSCCYNCCSRTRHKPPVLSETCQRLLSLTHDPQMRGSFQSTISAVWLIARVSVSSAAPSTSMLETDV